MRAVAVANRGSSNWLVYAVYGRGMHVQEALFSVLSANRFMRRSARWRTVIYTDVPEQFRTLPVEVVEITESQMSHWAGAHAYAPRAKIMVMTDALSSRGGSAVFVDA